MKSCTRILLRIGRGRHCYLFSRLNSWLRSGRGGEIPKANPWRKARSTIYFFTNSLNSYSPTTYKHFPVSFGFHLVFPGSVCLFFCREICGLILGINRSQTHECGNWDWGRAIPRKGIHNWDFPCSVPATAALWVQSQTSQKHKMGDISKRNGQHTKARQKICKKRTYHLDKWICQPGNSQSWEL